MGLAITTKLTRIVPLPRSLTRRSGAVAAIDMALPMELARLWRPQMRARCRYSACTLHRSLAYLRRAGEAVKSSVRSAMFIAMCSVGCVKLRRSGMNGAGDHDQADPDRAAPTELDSSFGGPRGYKHGAPNGACLPLASADAGKAQVFRLPYTDLLPICGVPERPRKAPLGAPCL